MIKEDQDIILQTLMDVRAEVAPKLDVDLLQQCYATQKKYQFSDDRALSTSAMERLITAKMAELSGDS